MIIQAKEGLRMYRRARRVKATGFLAYNGSPEQICRKIIDDAFDKERKYFRVSSGHFCEFYIRDFALCCEALVQLGYAQQVRLTLSYALERFVHSGRITTAINPEGTPFDYHMPTGPESIGLLLFSMRKTGNGDLAQQHKHFLQTQVDRVKKMATGPFPRIDKHYSSIRDQAKRKAPCYDAVMLAVVAREAKLLGFVFPYSEQEIAEKIKTEYWNGTYFFQDLHKQDIVVGDANVFPFWTGIFTDKKMLESAMTCIQAAQLDQPFPLRYVSQQDKKREQTAFHFSAMLAPDYETDSIWMHMGLAYLQVLAQQNRKLAATHLGAYTAKIEKYKTFLEVYDNNGEPLRGSLYVTDEAMLWCANYLILLKQLK